MREFGGNVPAAISNRRPTAATKQREGRNSFVLPALSDQRARRNRTGVCNGGLLDCPTQQGLRSTRSGLRLRSRHWPRRRSWCRPHPRPAQGLFDFFFNGPRRQGPPPSASSYADPVLSGLQRRTRARRRAVRHRRNVLRAAVRRTLLSDPAPQRREPRAALQFVLPGRRDPDRSPAPASITPLASNGSRYASLRNAFAYRERIVDNCTCNGRDAYGLVTLNVDRRSVAAHRRHRRHQRRLRRL